MNHRFLVLSSVLLQVGIINTKMNTLARKIVNLSSTNKTHFKCDVFNGSVVNSLRQAIFYSFVLDKLPVINYFPNQTLFIIRK